MQTVMPLTRRSTKWISQQCAHLPAKECTKPRGRHPRFRAKLHDIDQCLDQKVNQQLQIVQQYRESEVKQTNREVR